MATLALFLTLSDRLTSTVVLANEDKPGEFCNEENQVKSRNGIRKSVQLIPRAHEKETRIDLEYSYPEPAQVPLGE